MQIAPSHLSYLRHHIVSPCSLLYGLDKIGTIVIYVGGCVDWREPNDRKTTMLGNMWIEGHSTFVPDSDYDLNGRDDDLYGGALWRRWQSIEER